LAVVEEKTWQVVEGSLAAEGILVAGGILLEEILEASLEVEILVEDGLAGH
jgi:hypothetical protein